MKKQVSIKVYMDEDLYHFYSSIADGNKGQVIREALQLFRDLSSISAAKTLIEVKKEIQQGFEKIERLLLDRPVSISPSNQNENEQQSKPIEPDMIEMFDGFVQNL